MTNAETGPAPFQFTNQNESLTMRLARQFYAISLLKLPAFIKQVFTLVFMTSISVQCHADIFARFRNPDGSTKWQWVANFSSSVLILTLLIVLSFLLLTNRRARKANRELTDIKATLEDRVARRTASLIETTEHLKSREAYIANIVASMPVMLIGLDQDLNVIQWNKVAEVSTGRPPSAVLGKNLWEAYPAITVTPDQVKSVIHNQQPLTIKHAQRDQYYFDITLYSLDDKDQKGVIILVDDITKQMKAENKVAERDKISAMGELASAMAYDIHFPLQTILKNIDQAKENFSSKQQDISQYKTLLDQARLSGQQASAIIQNLLTLAASHQDQKEKVDITLLMDESIHEADKLFSDAAGLGFNDIRFDRVYPTANLSAPIFRAELQQVFVRLLRNAYHQLNAARNSISPAIRVELGEFYDSLWIKIEHNGKVLSPAEQEDIFVPFYSISARPAACPVEHRLSYPYFIITNHHRGQMSVTSENGSTCFNIQLPLA